ncbi:MBL fold metallo-hydrolase [Candidatus Obscuribacterales bacterium]|nr:MBL fold metallo-hydrolase [Candidatus Obscuribacterales bacterium]
MKLTLYGAANEVTGSCNLLEHGRSRILVDCGMFQGRDHLDRKNNIPPHLGAKTLDAVLLTHGHLDHCGRLPLLMRSGFRGPIYATKGTIEIAKIILADAANIQENEVGRLNRKRARAGLRGLKPLFNMHDVEQVFSHFHPVELGADFSIKDELNVRYYEAGHILGSASITVTANVNGTQKKLVFSGDLGQFDVPLMRDPAVINNADAVIMESTYGDRDHRTVSDTVSEFESIIKEAIRTRSKILIPSFAVGRTQSILYHLAEMFRNGIVEPIPIYLDSPMAIAATKIYLDFAELMDPEISELLSSGQLRKDLSTLQLCETAEQSQALNAIDGPCIIIAGAGMCNAGRIVHHLKHNLWKQNCYVIIVGYQAKGSLGRLLVEGAKKVKIMGDTISVGARIASLGGFSAHAGQSDLLRWLAPMADSKPLVILNHGESHALNLLSEKIREKFALHPDVPRMADSLVLDEKAFANR